MRRTTLGPVPGNAMNSRLSMAGPPARRQSEMPMKRKSSIRRKSSLGARKSGVGTDRRQMKDPRPIKDRKFKADSAMSVIAYLTEFGYEHTISKKILHSPNTKDFVNMFTFLVSRFDPNHRPNPNVQEYVLQQMKRLGYPFSISKSALQSVGSPHTWPHLLAMLAWMVELLQYEDAAKKSKDDFAAEDSEKVFRNYLAGAYAAFLDGDDDDDEEVDRWDAELDEQFELRNAATQNDVEQLADTKADLESQIEQLQKELGEFDAMEQRRDDMRTDVQKFHKLIEQLEEHKTKMEAKVQEKHNELEEKEAELQGLRAEKDELAKQVEQQEMSVGDVQRLVSEKQMIDSELQRAKDDLTALEQQISEAEQTFASTCDEVERDVQTYQSKAEALKLLPETAKNANGVDFSIKFNRHASVGSDFVNKDLKHEIKPRLGEVKSNLAAKYRGIQDDQFAAQEKLDNLSSKIQDHTDAIATQAESLERAEASIASEKEVWSEKKRSLTAQMDEVEARIHQLKTADETTVAQSQQKIEELHREYTETQHKCEEEKKAMNEALLSLTLEMTQHREYISKNLAEMAVKAEQILKEVELEDAEQVEDVGY